ncbi:MAG TPA: sugar phosphate isomerase/epimerase [Armatimonadetes bacterium]|nr:sugar phosphate isomerase/epimerase [Armatimonadota bacterium]
MKLACQENLVPGKDLGEKARKLEAWGFEGMEIWGGRFINGELKIDDVRKALEGTKVKVSSLCAGFRGSLLSPDPGERKQAAEDIKELLTIASELGAVGVIVVPIFGPPKIPDLSPWKGVREIEEELCVAMLKEVAPHAEKVKACVLVEPLNRYETHFLNRLEQAVAICERVGSEYVRIMADFFHMNIEEARIPEAIERAGPWIAHVHLADSNRLLPGWGHTDFKSGFSALRRIGYKNYMALECGVPGNPEETLPKSAQYLKECMSG